MATGMKLRHMTIHRFRSIPPGTTLSFSEGINILLGRNGTGKTTLLKLAAMMTRGDFSALDGEVFDVEYVLGKGEAEVQVRRGNERSEDHTSGLRTSLKSFSTVSLDGETAFSDSQRNWGFNIGADPSIADAYITALYASKEQITAEDMVVFNNPGRLDEAILFFDILVGRRESGEQVMPASFNAMLHTKLKVVRSEDNAVLAASLRQALTTSLSEIDDLQQLGVRPFSEKDLSRHKGATSFLEHFTTLIGAEGAKVTPRIKRYQEGRDSDPEGPDSFPAYAVFDALSFTISFPGGLTIRHDQLSYGQKRLLAFLYYLECCTEIVIADELVNGMHHHWIQRCIKLIGEHQALLTSQNPLLLDYLTFESTEQVRTSFILCDLEDNRWRWRNMTDAEAEDFLRAYDTGIQHVGEILQDKGLW